MDSVEIFMTPTDHSKRRVFYALAAAAAGAALSYAGYRLQKQAVRKRTHHEREKMLDKAVMDTMDCSDPIARY